MTLGRRGDFDGKCPKCRIGEILDGIMAATQNKLRSIFANYDACLLYTSLVKDVNTAISHRQAKHRGAMYRKSDSDDAEAIALATLNMLDKLLDACPNDAYWSLGQLVHRRDNIMKQRTRLVNQLHEQLCIAYPSYKSFFNDISRPTALYFWEHYPSKKYLKGKSVEDLRAELVPVSHNKCSTKTCEKILDAVASDKAVSHTHLDVYKRQD